MYVWCEQCGEVFHAQRSTAKYCTASCRVAFNRNKNKKIPKRDSPVKENETLLELIAIHNPKAFDHLNELRELEGLYAMDCALWAIADILKKDKIR